MGGVPPFFQRTVTTLSSPLGVPSSWPGLGTSLPTIFAARALDGFFCGNMGATGPEMEIPDWGRTK